MFSYWPLSPRKRLFFPLYFYLYMLAVEKKSHRFLSLSGEKRVTWALA
jgi:hypothetical protein